jgi:hypothetical protein
MCKGRVDMARGTRTPQRGRCVSGMELTCKRHAVVDVLTGLSFRVPYQPKIGTETQRLKNRIKHLCISLQCAIFFLFAPRGCAGSSQLAHARAWRINNFLRRAHFLPLTPLRRRFLPALTLSVGEHQRGGPASHSIRSSLEAQNDLPHFLACRVAMVEPPVSNLESTLPRRYPPDRCLNWDC